MHTKYTLVTTFAFFQINATKELAVVNTATTANIVATNLNTNVDFTVALSDLDLNMYQFYKIGPLTSAYFNKHNLTVADLLSKYKLFQQHTRSPLLYIHSIDAVNMYCYDTQAKTHLTIPVSSLNLQHNVFHKLVRLNKKHFA